MLLADTLTSWQDQVNAVQSSIGTDCRAFCPELILCGSIVVLMLLRLFSALNRVHLSWVALGLTIGALVVSGYQWQQACATLDPRIDAKKDSLELFSGLLIYDNFTIFLRVFLLGFAALVILLSRTTGIPDREDSADFNVLLLGATLGMCLMASSNHLLMVFLGVEMASLPSYALAGFLKGKRQGSEASLKYVVYGGGASGVMLYGISLLVGKFGTAYLPALAEGFLKHQASGSTQVDVVLMLGILFVLIGVAFKLSAVPFHFWCPDVFEGAPAEVAGFLSVASKGAALALLGRFALMLTGVGGGLEPVFDTWVRAVNYLAPALAFFAALTATFGNLAAYLQTNLKRLLAYSTIAHAGYMIMGLAPMVKEGAAAVLFYMVAYLFMNLGAFAVVAYLRNLTGSEDLRDCRGLIRRSPILVIVLGVFLLSLLGIPPLVGFPAKLQIFSVLFQSGQFYAEEGNRFVSNIMFGLLILGGLNTVISAVYYLKVLKVMVLEVPLEEVEGKPVKPLPMPIHALCYSVVLAAMILVLGVYWGPLKTVSDKGVDQFKSKPTSGVARS